MTKEPNIAKNLKFERDKLGWSLSKAAEETGVSKAMLGQIERGVSSPTIATLWKIVGGMHIPMSRLIDDGSLTQEFKREAHQRPIRFENSIGFKTLFPFDERLGNEMYEMTLAPDESHASRAHDLGVIEDIVVIQGEMEILIDGAWQKFKQGDAVRFRADQDHGYRNLSGHEARFHNIIHYPT